MGNIPEKTYFNKTTGQILDANGTVIADEKKFPFIPGTYDKPKRA